MIVYNIKSFSGGKSYFNDVGIAGSSKFISGAEIRGKRNSLKATQALKQEGVGIFEDLIIFFVPTPDGSIYGFGDNGRIYQRNTNTGEWHKVYTDPHGKIKGACLYYRHHGTNDARPYLFWATDTRLNRKAIPGKDDWSDVNEAGSGTGETYPKANLLSANWHDMKIAQHLLLIANGNLLAGVSYEDGGYSNEVNGVPLPPSLEITSIVPRGNNELIALCSAKKKDERACLYAIDMISVDWVSRADMSFCEVDTAIDGEFFLMVAEGRLWYTDLYSKLPIIDFPKGARVLPGGKAMRDNVALFAVSSAIRKSGNQQIKANGIWAYGRNTNASVPVLDLKYPIIAEELGGLYADNSLLLVARKFKNEDGSFSYQVMTEDEENKQICEYESLELDTPFVRFPNRQRIENIIIKTVDIPKGCKVEAFYRLDLQGDFIQAHFADIMEKQGSNREFTSGSEATYLIGAYAHTFEIKLKLTPYKNETPEVKEIYIEVGDDEDF